MLFTKTVARLLTLLPTVFLYPALDVMVCIGGQLDDIKFDWMVSLIRSQLILLGLQSVNMECHRFLF